ncbi:MAG TPA: DUF1464 family protein [Gemmatimonadaceae bacterium]|nr:DUF1464 family protein [Gemmatimonadaceae bacterium]
MRTIGIDPGTVSIDLCGIDDGVVFLDQSIPTREALADPEKLIALLSAQDTVELIAGPSGYGIPLTRISDVTDEMLRLAYLAPAGDTGGIGGLRTLARALARAQLPVYLTPGVIHLPTVPAYRKANRVDLGTADKVCVAALAVHEQSERMHCEARDTSFVLLELGGAFTAAIAVDGGRIVDGAGGSSGAMGFRSPGAMDGEVAFLAGEIAKETLFHGGAATIHGNESVSPERFAEPRSARESMAWDAYIESAVKVVSSLLISVPDAREILISGRLTRVDAVCRELALRLSRFGMVHRLRGFARVAKEAAQGAALIANGLAGGAMSAIVDALAIRDASGSVLDHLYVIDARAARRRLGLA